MTPNAPRRTPPGRKQRERSREEEDEELDRRVDLDRRKITGLLLGGALLATPPVIALYNWFGQRAEKQEESEEDRAIREELIKQGGVFDNVTGNAFQKDSIVHKAIKKLDKEGVHRELVDATDCEGNKYRGKDGKESRVRLAAFVAEKLKKADQLMFQATKEHIRINEHFRINGRQTKMIKWASAQRESGKGRVAGKIGRSFHEAGLAIDVVNWLKAEKYLIQAGLVGGMYTNRAITITRIVDDEEEEEEVQFRNTDAWHFSCREHEAYQDLDGDGSVIEQGKIKTRLISFYWYNMNLAEQDRSESFQYAKDAIKAILGIN